MLIADIIADMINPTFSPLIMRLKTHKSIFSVKWHTKIKGLQWSIIRTIESSYYSMPPYIK